MRVAVTFAAAALELAVESAINVGAAVVALAVGSGSYVSRIGGGGGG